MTRKTITNTNEVDICVSFSLSFSLSNGYYLFRSTKRSRYKVPGIGQVLGARRPRLEIARQTKVSEFQMTIRAKKNIFRLEIAVDDVAIVEMLCDEQRMKR